MEYTQWGGRLPEGSTTLPDVLILVVMEYTQWDEKISDSKGL